jgi:hypothetical protein
MLRLFVCAVVALGFCGGAALTADKADEAQKKSNGKVTAGKITNVDFAKGTITVNVKGKGEAEGKDMEFRVTDDTKVTVFAGDKKEELRGKDGLRNEQFKVGTVARIMTDEAGKVTGVSVGTPPKN